MLRFIHKLCKRKAFTLMECILATAIIGVGSTLVMGMVSLGYSYVNRSRSLDEVASVAQEKIALYDGTEAEEGLVDIDEDSGIRYGFSDKLQTRVAFEIFYGNSSATDVIMPTTMQYVAVIVTDTKDNKIVYYLYSPDGTQIQKLYSEKE